MRWPRSSLYWKNQCQLLFGITFLIGSGLLVGCSDCTGCSYSGSATQACEQSSVLITNLTQKPDDRSYQLTSGQDCTRVVKAW